MDVGHIGSRFHKEQGFDLDPRVAARFLHQASHQTTNYDLIYVWASRSGEVFDYIEDLGSKNGVSMVPALSGTAKYGNWSTLSDRWRVYPEAVSYTHLCSPARAHGPRTKARSPAACSAGCPGTGCSRSPSAC